MPKTNSFTRKVKRFTRKVQCFMRKSNDFTRKTIYMESGITHVRLHGLPYNVCVATQRKGYFHSVKSET